MSQQSIETRIAELKTKYPQHNHGSFEYDGTCEWCPIVRSHFDSVRTYGIYIVRTKSNKKILFIGMAGTPDSDGEFKNQDLPGRLTNVRGSKGYAKDYFKQLAQRVNGIVIEYLVLNDKNGTPVADLPNDMKKELLNLYKNENGGHLPDEHR